MTAPMTREELLDETNILPCPFCGKSPFVEMTGFHLGGRTIRCETDDCMGPHTTAACVDDAVIQWNRRAIPAPAQGAVNPDVVEGIAKTIWLAEFSRAFSRTPSDPWENQADPIKEGHRNTARKIIEAGHALPSTGLPAPAPQAEVREALEPFAKMAPFIEFTDFRDGEVVHRQYDRTGARVELTKEDFRRAAKALALPQSTDRGGK